MQFTKGVSGNPAGRPRGIKDKRHRFNEAIESMIPDVLDSVFQKAIAGTDLFREAIAKEIEFMKRACSSGSACDLRLKTDPV